MKNAICKIIIVSILIYSNCLTKAQDKPNCLNSWVDSVFQSNFQKMEYAVTRNAYFDETLDRYFIFMLINFSGIDCSTTDYSGFPYFNSEKLQEWKKWYDKKKFKLSKEKVIWAISILKDTDRSQYQLDSLHHYKIDE